MFSDFYCKLLALNAYFHKRNLRAENEAPYFNIVKNITIAQNRLDRYT